MNKKDKEKFIEFCHNYARRFKYCFTYSSDEKNYPMVFTKNHWGRVPDYFEEKYNITIKPTNVELYKIYEDIMLSEINKFIQECKAIQSEKNRKAAKNKQVKRKKQD